jgi:hypothetical protein
MTELNRVLAEKDGSARQIRAVLGFFASFRMNACVGAADAEIET